MKWMWIVAGTGLIAMPAFAQERPMPRRLDPARMIEQFDKNKDGFLDMSELPERMKERFAQMDANKDGKLSKEELEKFAGGPAGRPMPGAAPDALFRLLDTNNDGKLSKDELAAAPKLLEKLDRNKNGMIDPEEISTGRSGGGRPGEVITPAARGERQSDKLKVGDKAPDFTLPLLGGKGALTLSHFQGKKPVVLIFASYT